MCVCECLCMQLKQEREFAFITLGYPSHWRKYFFWTVPLSPAPHHYTVIRNSLEITLLSQWLWASGLGLKITILVSTGVSKLSVSLEENSGGFTGLQGEATFLGKLLQEMYYVSHLPTASPISPQQRAVPSVPPTERLFPGLPNWGTNGFMNAPSWVFFRESLRMECSTSPK